MRRAHLYDLKINTKYKGSKSYVRGWVRTQDLTIEKNKTYHCNYMNFVLDVVPLFLKYT
mgnify:CR=1 FL=1